MIDLISATRHTEDEFWNKTALGISLQRLAFDGRFVPRLRFANTQGLPEIYNSRIVAADANDILIFVHDDVWIDDHFVNNRVIEGLQQYDVIGVAGNKRCAPGQTGWPFVDLKSTWDEPVNLSGAVGHGKNPFGRVSFYGPVPTDCELLDGVFLAANRKSLLKHEVRFDSRFDFHFYDLDFCRTARQRGLRLGTWPIAITHQSGGAFGTPQWQEKYRAYLEKWGS